MLPSHFGIAYLREAGNNWEMLDERLQRRLESLNRGPLPSSMGRAPAATPAPVVLSAGASSSPLRPRAVQPIAGLMSRGREVESAAGKHLQIHLPLEEVWPGGADLLAKRKIHLDSLGPSPDLGRSGKELLAFLRGFPSQLLLMDLETCGLSGSPLFLVGLLRQVEGHLAIELLLARNYAEERAVLASFWERVAEDSLLVTFNGKSFDWPMVHDRTTRHLLYRTSRPPAPEHVDMLHHARRRWRKQLPDCRLQTIERFICGRGRMGDIAGSQIPAAYEQFVRTGKPAEIEAILLHNAIDLVTLLDIGMRLAG